ncbi:outer membrane beta-barrel protein [Shewanella surugensis]|uniref:Outer membrane beta-barrel protein n=1 Tax=Shewanella surugensis TaxID=212020 RepID=A0ABT0LDZ8_9GAMM|nr:outer membrane beta-barrel protein [Shewanella surugensis]MCL1125928.1 outer membrane beta-barrel protein [Shewanella surugensis]
MKTFLTAVTLLLTLGCANTAMAETNDTGFYVGGDIGRTQLKFGSLLDDSTTSVGAYGGYQFNEWFAIEGHVFGTADYDTGLEGQSGSYNGNTFTITKADVSAAAISITPKVTWQINEIFSAYAKAGISYMQVNSEWGATLNGSYGTSSLDYDGFGYVLGAGVNAAITPHLVVRLGYEFMNGDLETNDSLAQATNMDKMDTDLSQFSLGLHYQF